MGRWVRTICLAAIAFALAAAALAEVVAATNVAAGIGDRRTLDVPTWLVLVTGGAAIGASGLLATLVTDRAFVAALHEWNLTLVDRRPVAMKIVETAGGLLGVGLFAVVVLVGLVGPRPPEANLGVLLTFVGVRAVLPIVAFLAVNPWPTVNPFRPPAVALRRLVSATPSGVAARSGWPGSDTDTDTDTYPDRLGTWPAVCGLLALAWIEVTLPVTSDPRTLAPVTVGYGTITVAGAVWFSPEVWFRRVDPLAVTFRFFGAVAPVRREVGYCHRHRRRHRLHLHLQIPGARLRDRHLVTDASDAAFALLLVWELTFGGFVVTPPGERLVEWLVAAGLPPRGVYLLVLLAGYAAFLGGFWAAAALSRRVAPTYRPRRALVARFAPPLFAIAAGYHLAHYLGFALNLSPALRDALAAPLSPPVNPTTLAVPDWIGAVELACVLGGHVLAIWTAHAIALEAFPDRLQAIRSQYPFVLTMIAATVASIWLLSLPTAPPPYVG